MYKVKSQSNLNTLLLSNVKTTSDPIFNIYYCKILNLLATLSHLMIFHLLCTPIKINKSQQDQTSFGPKYADYIFKWSLEVCYGLYVQQTGR